jgi:hypothetical protein
VDARDLPRTWALRCSRRAPSAQAAPSTDRHRVQARGLITQSRQVRPDPTRSRSTTGRLGSTVAASTVARRSPFPVKASRHPRGWGSLSKSAQISCGQWDAGLWISSSGPAFAPGSPSLRVSAAIAIMLPGAFNQVNRVLPIGVQSKGRSGRIMPPGAIDHRAQARGMGSVRVRPDRAGTVQVLSIRAASTAQ